MRRFFHRLWLLDDNYFIFWTTLLFYFLLFFNLNNKTLFGFFFFFILLLFLKFKSVNKVLFWGFIASFPFVVGKTYVFRLISPIKILPSDTRQNYDLPFVVDLATIIALFLLSVLISKLIILRKQQKLSFDLNLFFLTILLLLTLLSTLYSDNITVSSLFFLKFLQGPLLFLSTKYFFDWREEKNRSIFIFLLLAQGVFEAIWIFLQFFHGGPLGRSIEFNQEFGLFGKGTDEDIWHYRPPGTFNHSNFAAALLLPIITLIWAGFYHNKEKYRKIFIYLLYSFILIVLAVFITWSRSAWFSLFLSIFLLTYIIEKKYHFSLINFYKKRFLLIFIVFLLVFPIIVLPRLVSTFNTFASGGSFYTRVELIQASIEVINHNLFLGTGFGMSVSDMYKNNPRGMIFAYPVPVHSWYFLFASEVGILALLAFIFLVNSCLRKISVIIYKKDIFLTGVFVAIIAISVNAFFQPYLGNQNLFFILLGILSTVKSINE